jgi:hypothetical protein
MTHSATHPNFSTWQLRTIQVDRPIVVNEKSVSVSGELIGGTVYFPLSCVNVISQFELEVPVWLLKKSTKNLNHLI